MKRILTNTIAAAALLVLAGSAQAQATRTWVSGVGDDVNPCSRTAPCKTWAGAISKTAAGGEINAIDPGGFGAVTITKSITIDGRAMESSTLASGTSGIIINALSTDAVILRNLSINGGTSVSPGLRGVSILSAKEVSIENCDIFNFGSTAAGNGRAISVTVTNPVNVSIRNTTMSNNAQTAIVISPTAGSPIVNMNIYNSIAKDNGTTPGTAAGLFAGNGARVIATNSTFANNTQAGVEAGGNSNVNLTGCTIYANQTGVVTSGTAIMRLSGNNIAQNTGAGFSVGGGTTMFTFADNIIQPNGAANVGALTAAAPGKQ